MADLDVKYDGPVATVTINRAEQRNALRRSTWLEVAGVFSDLTSDNSIRVALLSGSDGNFSVGADIAEFGDARASGEQARDYELAVDSASYAIADCPKPTIAVVSGYCLGGGCHLAMACDFRIADRSATFGIPAAKLSIVYGVRSTQRLVSLVGLPAAKRILFTAQRFDAAEALKLGFADEVVSDPMAKARDLALQMAGNAPLSLAGAKAILTGLSMGTGELNEAAAQRAIDLAADSADYNEGRRAFAEKRAPRFQGV
ncbi:MAG: enoyl-CoA hydratase/isomerase family protein [Hyphomonadaceae bacterium]|nr:enoyl-CoA hydratase/isomerase family protein [Hyphomonadaceae bacterium]